MENNRTILAVALIILLWSGYSIFFPSQQPIPTPVEPVVEEQQIQQQNNKLVTSQIETSQIENLTVNIKHEEKIINVVSDNYDIKLSTIGATLRSVKLNKFKKSKQENSESYELITFSPTNLANFKTSGSEGISIPSDLPFQLVGEQSDKIKIDSSNRTISFSAVTSSGLKIIKNYTFSADNYQIGVSVQLVNGSAAPINGYLNLSLISVLEEPEEEGMQDMYTFIGPLSFDGEELLEEDLEDLDTSAKIYGDGIVWSGFVTKYFLTILSPGDSAKQVQIEKKEGYVQNKFVSPYLSLDRGQTVSLEYDSYFGPLDYDLLLAAGHQFEEAKDYGFFSVLAKPLMHVLKFFYKFLGNYGFSIILLTVCIKLIFWPLTQKSYKSMKGMQTLQPEMQKLREKYGSDKQRLNQEMMSFYKDNKVNPMGGCLPMLIQIPVFFALYQVLLGAIELRHAPFIFWLTDLSVKDPYYITPLIMGATMFIQQKMTPTNMDPNQAKIMLMMPVVFTFLFLNFPSGLVVYWMVNNLLTILQQYLIRRQPA